MFSSSAAPFFYKRTVKPLLQKLQGIGSNPRTVLCGMVDILSSLIRKIRSAMFGFTSEMTLCPFRAVFKFTTVLGFLVASTSYVTPQTRAVKPRRDPAALLVLQNEMNALGGTEAWVNLHGMKVHGSRRISKEAAEEPFTWEDHWDNRYKFYRDTFEGGKQRRFLQDPDHQKPSSANSSASSTNAKKPLVPPEMDPVNVLLLHIPAAAIFHVLNHQEYSVTLANIPMKDRESGRECIRIRKQIGSPNGAPVNVVLCSGSDSHVPLVAHIELQNLIHAERPLYEDVRYLGFAPINGLLLPTRTEIKRPTGQIHSLVFHDLIVNPVPEPTAFGGGAR